MPTISSWTSIALLYSHYGWKANMTSKRKEFTNKEMGVKIIVNRLKSGLWKFYATKHGKYVESSIMNELEAKFYVKESLLVEEW